MKFPKATVVLVVAAVLFVVWDQTREPPVPLDASSFTNLSARPVERSAVLDWAAGQVSSLCKDATGASEGQQEHSECVRASKSTESACRRAAADQFPAKIASESVFRDLSINMMNCLVRQSRLLD